MSDLTRDFEVVSISRRDLQDIGLSLAEADSLTDLQMQEIAQEVSQLYVDRALWDDLRYVVRRLLAERKGTHNGSSRLS